jgi:hypothetical protein
MAKWRSHLQILDDMVEFDRGQSTWEPRGVRRSRRWQAGAMCRNIRTLHNFEPPATAEECRASALQYVRKISGMNKPSAANAAAFDRAVATVTATTQELVAALTTHAPPRDREVEAAKARARAAERYATLG